MNIQPIIWRRLLLMRHLPSKSGQAGSRRGERHGTLAGWQSWAWRCLPPWRPAAATRRPSRRSARRSGKFDPRGPRRQARAADHRLHGRPAGLRGCLRADVDFLQGLRLHQAFLRGHRPGGEKRRSAGGDFRSRTGRRPSAKGGPGRVGPEDGRAGPAVGRGGREQASRRRSPNWPRRKPTWASTRPKSFAGSPR